MLSMHMLKTMTEWQQNCETVVERDSFILQQEMWTDCVFLVGQEEQEFHVHRLMLAKSSPAMAAMLYGEIYRKDEPILLSDVSPAAFEAMLLYMYEGRVELGSFKVACELLYASKKYLLHASLLARLRAFLWRSLYPDNVWQAFMFASNNDEPGLLETAMQIIQMQTSTLILLDSFLDLPQSCLVQLVQSDQLAVSELELYKAIERWGRQEVKRKGEAQTGEALKGALAPVIPHIRFLAMTKREFSDGPDLGDVLNQSQKSGIKLMNNKRGKKRATAVVPEKICCKKRARKIPTFNSFFVFGTDDEQIKREEYDGYALENSYNVLSASKFHTRRQVTNLGVVVPTQLKEENSGGEDSYDEDLTVLLIQGPDRKVLSATRFKTRVNFNSTVQVPNKQKLVLEEHTIINAKVVFHKSGRYPAKIFTKQDINYKGDFDETQNAHFFCSPRFKYVHAVVAE